MGEVLSKYRNPFVPTNPQQLAEIFNRLDELEARGAGAGGGGGGGSSVKPQYGTYLIYQRAGEVYAVNLATGGVEAHDDASTSDTVFQYVDSTLTSGGMVLIKSGTYSFSKKVTKPPDVDWLGEGPNTIISMNAADYAVETTTNYNQWLKSSLVSNIRFIAADADALGAIHLVDCFNQKVDNVMISDFTKGVGILLDNSAYWTEGYTLTNLNIRNCLKGIAFVKSGVFATTSFSYGIIDGYWISVDPTNGIGIEIPQYCDFVRCVLDGVVWLNDPTHTGYSFDGKFGDSILVPQCETFNLGTGILVGQHAELDTCRMFEPRFIGTFNTSSVTIGTIGRTTDGTTDDTFGYLTLQKQTMPVNGTITEISVYSRVAGNAKVGIYADAFGSPGALLSGPDTLACSAGVTNTKTLTTPVTLTAGTDFWIACNRDTTGTTRHAATGGTSCIKALSYATAWPDPAGAGYTSEVYDFAYYATYTTAGSGTDRILNPYGRNLVTVFEQPFRIGTVLPGGSPTAKFILAGSNSALMSLWSEPAGVQKANFNGTTGELALVNGGLFTIFSDNFVTKSVQMWADGNVFVHALRPLDTLWGSVDPASSIGLGSEPFQTIYAQTLHYVDIQASGTPGITQSFTIKDGDGTHYHHLTFTKGILSAYVWNTTP